MRYQPHRFAYGVLLSGFIVGDRLPGDTELEAIRPPVFWGRGAQDFAISRSMVEQTAAWLPSHTTLETRVYGGLGHGISEQELIDIADFIEARI